MPRKGSVSKLTTIGLVCSCLGIFVPFLCSAIGIVLLVVARVRERDQDPRTRNIRAGYQTIGLALGVFGLMLWLAFGFLTVYFGGLH